MNKVHFTGIGGTGAYYLAQYFLSLGYQVSGSDINQGDRVKDLISRGAIVKMQPLSDANLSEIGELDLYIFSPALPKDHPEVVYFQNKATRSYDVGQITAEIIAKYNNGELTSEELAAVGESMLIPLVNIDWNAKKYIGVTGTDGKTTTSTFINYLFEQQGLRSALISTLGVKVGDKFLETGLHTTTPTAQELYHILTLPEMEKIDVVVLETTSHALAMGRVAGAKFDVGVITNITGDHLDYHGSFETYLQTKATLLTDHLKTTGIGIINPRDEMGYPQLKPILEQAQVSYLEIDVDKYQISLPEYMQTHYNESNAAQAMEAVNRVTEQTQTTVDLSGIPQISGRMEVVQQSPFQVIIDFAHTANGLRQVVSAVAARKGEGKLHLVFGCPGMRDRTKRQPMGLVAYEFADHIYLCVDDPRTETLASINSAILKGMNIDKSEADLNGEYYSFPTDKNTTVELFQEFSVNGRKAAIVRAIDNAQPGDIVLITGKSHEKSLSLGTTEHEWNEFSTVKELLH